MSSIRNNDGSMALIAVIKILLLIIVVGVGIEFYRAYVIKTAITSRVRLSCQNALELSMDDRYRREHLSLVDSGILIVSLNELIAEELVLSKDFTPLEGSLLKSKLVITNLMIGEGSIDNKDRQESLPYVIIEGKTLLPIPLVTYLVDREAEINFNIKVTNKRYE